MKEKIAHEDIISVRRYCAEMVMGIDKRVALLLVWLAILTVVNIAIFVGRLSS